MASTLRRPSGPPTVPTRIQFQDFQPDADPISPGIFPDMNNLYSTSKGFRAYPSLVDYSLDALPDPCVGAFGGYLGSQFVIVAGTAFELYILSPSTKTWINQAIGGIGPNVKAWDFDIYGNLLIATNGVNPPYAYNGVGTFAPLAGNPPVAALVQATDYSLFLISPNSADFWFSLSATIWTPSIATETVHGDLLSTHGNITAAQRIRNGIALYKPGAIHMGQFTQPPLYWEFRVISEQIGVPCQSAVANLGDVNYFPGNDDFYSFDGYSLNRIPNNLKEWWFEHLDGDNIPNIVSRWDPTRNLIFWHFPSIHANPAGTLDMWIALNIRNGKWTACTSAQGIEMPLFTPIPAPRFTYGVFQARYNTYGDIFGTYGQAVAAREPNVPAVISSSQMLQTYSGVPGNSSLTTHAVGNRLDMFEVSRIRPQFSIYPASGAVCKIEKQYVPGLDSAPATGPAAKLSVDGWFNLRSTARLQKFKMDFQADFEIVAMELDCDYAGDR